MNLSEFYKNEYAQFAMYDNFRSISSYIDFKPSARKIIHTVRQLNINKHERVCDVASDTSKLTKYKHGNVSLEGVIVGLAQDFPCSNNINLLYPDGSFGTRTIPVPAASRYIHSCKTKILDKIIRKDDDFILIAQEAEGQRVEPKFFIPIIPTILVNGSEGIGNGYAQKILARNPNDIIHWISCYINSKKLPTLTPYYKGFNGRFVPTEDQNKWECWGKMEKGQYCSVVVTELPIEYTLKTWIATLNLLEERKVIKSYIDESNDNEFFTTIKVDRSFLDLPEEEQYMRLKLVKTYTENFTCMDEDNKIIEFDSAKSLLEEFITLRLKFYQKRRVYKIDELRTLKIYTEQKYNFIIDVINGNITIGNMNKKELESVLLEKKYVNRNDSYEYLIGMPMYSMTTDKVKELESELLTINLKIEQLENTTSEAMWLEELKELKGELQ